MTATTAWQRTTFLDGKQHGRPHAVYKASDGYLVVGTDGGKGLLIKTDGDGVTRWVQRYSSTPHTVLNCAKETRDGGYVLVGMASGKRENDGVLIKTFANGKEDWHKVFTGKCDRLHGIAETEKGYILAGSTSGGKFGYVIKTDLNGKMTSDATFGTPKLLDVFDSIRRIKGGFLLVGTTARGAGDRNGWVMKLDPALNKLHEKIYKLEEPLFLTCSLPMGENGYLLGGMINSKGYKAYLMKVDNSLSTEWHVAFAGGDNELYPSLSKDMDGTYTVLISNSTANNKWISKLSARPDAPPPASKICRVIQLDQPPPPEVLKKVEKLIAQLGADSYLDREAAQKELTRMGKTIVFTLRNHADNPDLEIRLRLEEIIKALAPPP